MRLTYCCDPLGRFYRVMTGPTDEVIDGAIDKVKGPIPEGNASPNSEELRPDARKERPEGLESVE
jgi:hypothetical protein